MPDTNNTVTIIAAIVTVVGTIIGVVIANRLTFSQSYKQKLWELRRHAYGVVLSELGMIERICDDAAGYIEQDAERYFESVSHKDDAKIATHLEAIETRMADDQLILSDAFIALYGELTKQMSSDDSGEDDEFEVHQKFVTAIKKYRPLLLTLARVEMTIPKNWWLPSA